MEISNLIPNPSKNKKRQAKRADFDDYKAPGYYHITITAYPGSARLSTINMPDKTILIKNEMIIADKVLVAAMVDRLTHKAIFVNMAGESYRLKETKN